MASYIGINQNTCSYWENGKVKIDTDSALKLAEFFNVSMDYLLCRDEKEAGSPEDEPARIGLRREKLLKELEESANTLDVNSLLKVLGYTEGLSKSRKRNHVIKKVHKLLICQIIGKF